MKKEDYLIHSNNKYFIFKKDILNNLFCLNMTQFKWIFIFFLILTIQVLSTIDSNHFIINWIIIIAGYPYIYIYFYYYYYYYFIFTICQKILNNKH